MAVAVIVPWRPGCPHREAAWQWVSGRYRSAHPDWELVEGHLADGPWIKAAAVIDALSRTAAETLIIADADCWVDGLEHAAAHVQPGQWATPHLRVHRLTQQATADVLAGAEPSGPLTQRPYPGIAGGGIVALHRDDYQRAPLDPRFAGWGQEDASWGLALSRIIGRPLRGRSPLWHLWHPPQPRQSRVFGSEAGKALHLRYRNARNPADMAALIEEARCHASRSR